MNPPAKPDLEFVCDLIHRCSVAALASHSVAAPGFPYATAVGIAPGIDDRPWMLLSRLAEHRINLEADARASVHLIEPDATTPANAARVTLIGHARRVDAKPHKIARFLRYQPAMEALLSLGDFAFFALDWTRSRAIGGFARMNWVDRAPSNDASAHFIAFDEGAQSARVQVRLHARVRLLGVDPRGIDLLDEAQRRRVTLDLAESDDELLTQRLEAAQTARAD